MLTIAIITTFIALATSIVLVGARKAAAHDEEVSKAFHESRK